MKTVEDLIKSREQRASILEEFGEIPQSIMVHNRSVKAIDLMAEKRNYGTRANNGGHTASVFDVSGQSVRAHSKAFSSSDTGNNAKNCRNGEVRLCPDFRKISVGHSCCFTLKKTIRLWTRSQVIIQEWNFAGARIAITSETIFPRNS